MSANGNNNATWSYFVDHLILPPENYTAIFEAEYASDMTSMSLSFTYEYQKQIIITVGAVAGAGILALLLFWFFMSLRCCFQCIRCLPRAPTDEEIEKYNIPLDYFEEENEDEEENEEENDTDNNDENKSNLEDNHSKTGKKGPLKRHYCYQHISYSTGTEDNQSASMVDDEDNQSRFSRNSRGSRSSGSRPHPPRRRSTNSRDTPRGTDALTAANTSLNASPLTHNHHHRSHAASQESKLQEDLEQGQGESKNNINTEGERTNDNPDNEDEEDNDSEYSDSDTSSSSYAWSEESWRDITKRLYPYTPHRIAWLAFFLICSLLSLGCCVYIFLSTQTLSLGVRQVKETGISLFNVVEQVYNSSQQLEAYGSNLQTQYDNLDKLVQNYSAYTPLQYYAMQTQHAYIDPLCVALANDTTATQSLFETFASALQEYDTAVQGLDTVVSPLATNKDTDDSDNAFTVMYEDQIEYYYADGVALYVLFGISVTAVLFVTIAVFFERKRAVQFAWVWMSAVYLLLWILSVLMFVVTLVLGDWCIQESPMSYLLTETLPYLFKQSLFGLFQDEELQNKLIRNLAYYTACTPGLEDESNVHMALSSANALLSTLRTSLFAPLSAYNYTLSDASNATLTNSCLLVVGQVNDTLSRVAHQTQTVLPASTSCPVIQQPLLQWVQRDVCVTVMRGSFRLWGSVSLLLMLLMCLGVSSSVLVQYSLSWDDMKPPYDHDEKGVEDEGEDVEEEVQVRENEEVPLTDDNNNYKNKNKKNKKKNKSRRSSVDEDLGSDSDGEVEVDADGTLWLITPAVLAEDGHTVMVPAKRRRLDDTNYDITDNNSQYNGKSSGRRDKTGKTSGKQQRPVSLRSILTVEYWTRPLPATPNQSDNNSNRSNHKNNNNNNNNANHNINDNEHNLSGYSNRRLPSPPGSQNSPNNRRRSHFDPSVPVTNPATNNNGRRRRNRSVGSHSDTQSEMSSLSGASFSPPKPAPQRRTSAYNSNNNASNANNSYHYFGPHQNTHSRNPHLTNPHPHPHHLPTSETSQNHGRKPTQRRRSSTATGTHTHAHHHHHHGTHHHAQPSIQPLPHAPQYGLVPQASFMAPPSPPPAYMLQTQPSLYLNTNNSNVSPTNASNNTMLMPMGGTIAYF